MPAGSQIPDAETVCQLCHLLVLGAVRSPGIKTLQTLGPIRAEVETPPRANWLRVPLLVTLVARLDLQANYRQNSRGTLGTVRVRLFCSVHPHTINLQDE